MLPDELLDEPLPQLVEGLEGVEGVALLEDEPQPELELLDDELLDELLDDELLDDELLEVLPSLAVLIVRKETSTRLVMMFFMNRILNILF